MEEEQEFKEFAAQPGASDRIFARIAPQVCAGLGRPCCCCWSLLPLLPLRCCAVALALSTEGRSSRIPSLSPINTLPRRLLPCPHTPACTDLWQP